MITLQLWSALKVHWLLRSTSVLKWQIYNETLMADRRHEEMLEMPRCRCNQQHFNRDPNAKSILSADDVKKTFGAFQWVTVDDVTLYTKINSIGRPYQVWLYNHRSRYKNILFQENNESCTINIAITRDQEFITVNSNARTSSEVHILRANELQLELPSNSLQLIRERRPRTEYYVDHAHGRFYVLSNDNQTKEFKVMVGEDDAVDVWRDYYIPTNDIILQDMELYQNHVVLYGLRDLIPVAIVIDAHDRTMPPTVVSDKESCHMDKYHSNKFECDEFYFRLSSPVKPSFFLTHKGTQKQARDPKLKQLSFFPEKFTTASQEIAINRFKAISKDGCAVPLTVCYRTDLVKQDKSAPLLIHVYGCYGENVNMAYCPEKQPLLDRGWVLVYCHVRGGGELGRKWYYDGMGENKYKSFLDLYACVDYVQSELNLSRPDLTALTGRSAGALPVAMFCNLWPHKAQAALLQSPLVNLVYSLSDSSSYLSIKDMEEFVGNTSSHQCDNSTHSICPYCCLKSQDYPAMYITASKLDEMIPFEGVKQYVNKLQSCIKEYKRSADHHVRAKKAPEWKKNTINRGTVLFNVNHNHGHYYTCNKEKYKEAAQQYSFLVKALCYS